MEGDSTSMEGLPLLLLREQGDYHGYECVSKPNDSTSYSILARLVKKKKNPLKAYENGFLKLHLNRAAQACPKIKETNLNHSLPYLE